jgi:hypothetical protein
MVVDIENDFRVAWPLFDNFLLKDLSHTEYIVWSEWWF